jgi:hypothetical protein
MKVLMKETTIFEGQRFEKGKQYEIDEPTYKALGSSIEKIVEKAKNTAISNKDKASKKK